MTPTPPVTTTQSRHPWAAVRRTLLALLGFAAVMAPAAPAIVKAAGVGAVPWVAGALAVAAAITRVLAVPAVEVWMRQHVPTFAAAPVKRDE